jgi:Ran GTPase-activating protein (RanGAP) involved in mRNA processing and transport
MRAYLKEKERVEWNHHMEVDDCELLALTLKKNTLISEVVLNRCQIGAKEMRALTRVKGTFDHVQVLELADNNLEDEGMEILSESLAGHSGIQINVSGNSFGQYGAEKLAELLLQNAVVELAGNFHAAIARAVEQSPRVKALCLTVSANQKCRLSFSSHPTLEELNIHSTMRGNSQACPVDLKWLGEELANSSSLKRLHCAHVELSEKAAKMLGEGLGRNTCMEEVELPSCRLGDAGVAALLKGLASNRSVKVLNLSFNGLSDAGFKLIGNFLKVSTTALTHLNLDCFGLFVSAKKGWISVEDGLVSNGRVVEIQGATRKVHPGVIRLLQRNEKAWTMTQQSALCLLCIRAYGKVPLFGSIPKELVAKMARLLLGTRGDFAWVDCLKRKEKEKRRKYYK